MAIIGSQKILHQEHMEEDAGDYTSKIYTLTVRLYEAGSTESELAMRRFEDEILNKVILAGKGRLRVDTLTD